MVERILDDLRVEVQMPSLEPVQLLCPDGTYADDPRYALDLEADDLLALYELLAVSRYLDQEFINLQRQGELALYPSCRGQEAAQVGSAYALSEQDWIFPQYRELAAFLVRGVDPVGVAQMWRGVRHGGSGLIERHCAPISIPIGTHALHAVGMAFGASLDGQPAVAVAYIGDGATSEGDVHEALNFAAVFRVPCIFFVQNNQWAISVPVSEQTRAPSIAHKAVAYGMPGVRCDGNDVLACYAVTRKAAERARAGEGPTLIEAVTYRMEAHTTSDDPTRYRSADELAAWASLDPISRFATYLRGRGLLTETLDEEVVERARGAAARLRDGVVGAPDPDPLDVFAHVYADPPPSLLRQAEQLRWELSAEQEK